MLARLVTGWMACVLLASAAVAQNRGISNLPTAGVGMPPGPAAPMRPFLNPQLFHGAVFLGAPLFYPDYTITPVTPSSAPQVVVVLDAPPAVTEPTPQPEPLLIEWDG